MPTVILAAALAVLLLFPETPAGRIARRALVEWPAAQLARLKPATVVMAVLLLAVSAALIWLAKTDGVFLVAQGLPEALAWLAAVDLSAYVDLLAVAVMVAATVRIKTARQAVRATADRIRRGLRGMARRRRGLAALRTARRPRRARPDGRRTSDDEGRQGLALA